MTPDTIKALAEIDAAIELLIRKDGDRDHMNHSNITCEQSMAIVALLRYLRSRLATQPGPGQIIGHGGVPFDPTNHHNALVCPYCTPERATQQSGDGKAVAWRSTIIRLLWEKQFEGSPWESKFHLIRPESLEADYGTLADKIIAAHPTALSRPSVEDVARVIAPASWKLYEQNMEFIALTEFDDDAKRTAAIKLEQDFLKSSLGKAKAILALFPPVVGE